MRLAESKPQTSAKQLERLAKRVASASDHVVSDWHVEQTLSLASTMRSEAGDHRGAARILGQLASHHEAKLRYHQRALVSALSAQALDLVSNRDRAGATRALRQAAPRAKGLRPPEKLFLLARRRLKRGIGPSLKES
ncbi:MAG TPA: hypothetical protein VJN96_09690 [Vicinamibacterales bacterium]|nr:hypothetical protein [Vicinamibacterales bacterium]